MLGVVALQHREYIVGRERVYDGARTAGFIRTRLGLCGGERLGAKRLVREVRAF